MIHKEGKPFVLGPLLFSALSLLFKKKRLALGLLGLSLANVLFFRNPRREPIYRSDLLISPADGKIICCQMENRPDWYPKPLYRIGIFMRLWDVHVNRAPISGKLLKRLYLVGEKKPVFLEKALEKNEKMVYLFEREDGLPVWVIQIAGLIARRIKSFVLPGDDLVVGDPIGIIKFSSRVELFFPAEEAELFVKIGQKVLAGETVIAKIPLQPIRK
ncbi:MAG: phosphatidylserine decarboxylase [Caldimicrobium sp.]|nr:phosphatidylserine decarboxylase [Caldimicrobium sp.]MCX7874161.1 phosphatidylserine decarboxylase [Caldimicrobium sp.]MDW8093705.1 phosphatidylserine decarboxylase [Caldimicrobium sp.]